ncbi:MAG: PrgI family protein [Candidatus Wildermuthbacteria bacterium]|nr:PrgI family protein [Candidatus Wildermuthbacteria bacterium]
MRFQVPQFIEHEPKVIGPLTFKQFLYLAVPGAFAFFLYFTAPFIVFILGTVLLGMFGFALGFLKAGGKSLPALLMSFWGYSANPKTYIWKAGNARRAKSAPGDYERTEEETEIASQVQLGTQSRIKNLGTQIDTKK